MGTKLEKSAYPTNHSANDLQCFGPPAVKDGEFEQTMIADCGCFTQDGKDTNKYYHGAVVQSKLTQKWYAYFEWGRQGAKNPQFQMVECSSKEDAIHEYASQLHEKNDKRGQWNNHPTLGRILQAKAGKDCYLVRPQATRSTGLPDARTIKMNEGVKVQTATKTKVTKKTIVIDPQTIKLMRDLNVATVSYTRGAMTDDSLPTQGAIDEARDILGAAMGRVKVVGDVIDDQIKDTELKQLTSLMYGRIPKKKERNAAAETWILSKDNISFWQQDLDAFQSALATVESGDVADPLAGMNIKMEWLSSQSELGKFIYNWLPKATKNKHGYKPMNIKNLWKVDRNDEQNLFSNEQLQLKNRMPLNWNNEKPIFQPSQRVDLNQEEVEVYKTTNTALLFHGTRTQNTTGLLREGFRFPKELIGVPIAGAMFSGGAGGIYFADDIGKSMGYTSLRNSYYTRGSGSIESRDAFMFLCDVALGVPHVAPGPHPYTKYPDGTHCIFGKAGKSQVQNNEWIILKKPQYKFRYLVEFVA
jgi:hypothetical protein